MPTFPPLIPRESLFELSCLAIKISPDGKQLASIEANRDGAMNLFIAPDLSFQHKRQMTAFRDPEIRNFHWLADSKTIIFLKDTDGTQQFHLFLADIESGHVKNLTERYSPASIKIFKVSPHDRKALVGINKRNPTFHDVYMVDFDTGKFSLFLQNDDYIHFLFDDELRLIAKTWMHEDSSITCQITSQLSLDFSAEDAFQSTLLHYSNDSNALYLIDNRQCNTTQLKKICLNTRDEEILGQHEKSDIGDVLFEKGRPSAYSTYFLKKEWHPLNAKVKTDIEEITSKLSSNFDVLHQSRDGKFWVLKTNAPQSGWQFWLFNRQTTELIYLDGMQKNANYVDMYPLIISTSDGVPLVSYLTLPKDSQEIPKSPLPLIVFPHGGPFKVRDFYAFSPFHQWLANRGYAVLSVNFRLSSGFGKHFVNAGNGQWGKKAHQDILDAIHYCIDKKIADETKIAIMGISYGGYEALASLTFTPNLFACAISICGPSNLKTVLDRVPFYWELPSSPVSDHLYFFTKKAFITSMGGDPDQEQGKHYLNSCSPLNYVENIQRPLLLIHGKNDPIVASSESDQIFAKLKGMKIPTLYLSFQNEGHGIKKFANLMCYLAYSEWLLASILGGRCEPIAQETLDAAAVCMQSSGFSNGELSQIVQKNEPFELAAPLG